MNWSTRRFRTLSVTLVVPMAIAFAGCSRDCVADGPPLVHFDGRTYTADLSAAPVPASQLGPVVFAVTEDRAAAISSCDWNPADGDASLPIGSEFHSIRGFDESEQLAAEYFGVVLRFVRES